MTLIELFVGIGQVFLTLLIIVDPLGNLPIVSGLLRHFTPEERRRSIDTSVLVSLGILLAAALVGNEVLKLFSINTGEMLIAGAVLFAVIGLDMMFGFLPAGTCDPRTACVVPVATPLLAGPGAITTVLLTVHHDPFPSGYIIAIAASALAMVVTWLVLRRTEALMGLMGERGALIVGKLMGILLMAIAVSFAVRGVELVARGLAGG